MKILQIHSFYSQFGGEDRVAVNEAEALTSAGHKVVTFYKENSEVWLYSFAKKARLPFRILRNRRCSEELRRVVAQTQPDVAHIHNIYPLIPTEIYRILSAARVPVVQSLHDHRLSQLCPQGNSYRGGAPCDLCHQGNFLNCLRFRCVRSNLLMSIAYSVACWELRRNRVFEKYASALICPNEYMYARVRCLGLPSDKVFVKPHFLSREPGLPSYAQKEYAVFLGAVSKHKGILTAVRAFSRMPSIELRVIGEGDLSQVVSDKARTMSNLRYYGAIKDGSRLDVLRDASCLIAPSECWETFGMNIIESFACGVPVIASRIGAYSHLVKDGKTGYLFEMGSEDDLFRKVQKLFADRQEALRMGRSARREYETEYTPEGNVERLVSIYDAAIH